MEKKYCTAMVLAVGRGNRTSGKTAEQYMEIDDEPPIAYALEVFETSPVIGKIILMTDVGRMEYVGAEIAETYGSKKVSTIEAGDSERYESVRKTLCTLTEREEEERESAVRDRQDGYVFIHDRARPSVTSEITERTYRAICSYNACMVGMPARDTIKLVNREGMIGSNPDRSMMWQAQTPQVFPVPLIAGVFAHQMKADCTGITDDAIVVEVQVEVKAQVVMGSYINIKIMMSEDLFMAEVLENSAVWLRISSSGDTE